MNFTDSAVSSAERQEILLDRGLEIHEWAVDGNTHFAPYSAYRLACWERVSPLRANVSNLRAQK